MVERGTTSTIKRIKMCLHRTSIYRLTSSWRATLLQKIFTYIFISRYRGKIQKKRKIISITINYQTPIARRCDESRRRVPHAHNVTISPPPFPHRSIARSSGDLFRRPFSIRPSQLCSGRDCTRCSERRSLLTPAAGISKKVASAKAASGRELRCKCRQAPAF